MTRTTDGRLTEVSRYIDELEARMHVHGPDDRQRIRRDAHALRQEQANALAVARHAPDRIGSTSAASVAPRGGRAAIRRRPGRARSAFTAAVDGELQGWDVFERLHTTAAARTGTARAQAEAGVTELRRRPSPWATAWMTFAERACLDPVRARDVRNPGDGGLVLLALIAAFSLVKGSTELVVATGGARVIKRQHNPRTGATG
jgi:hypothetical protein